MATTTIGTETIGDEEPSVVNRGRLGAALGGGAIALAVAVWTTALSRSVSSPLWWQEIPPRVVGVAIAAVGVRLWVRLPSPRIGVLMVAGAAVYYLQYLRAADGVLFAVGFCTAYAYMGFVGHVLLSWPDGRLHGWVDRVYVVFAYLLPVGTQTIRYFVDRPTPPWAIHIAQRTTLWTAIGSISALVMGVFAIVVVLGRLLVASPARRVPSAGVWIGVGLVGSIKIAEAAVTVLPGPDQVKFTLAAFFTVAVLLFIPAMWVTRRLHTLAARLRVVNLLTDLERDLDTITDPLTLQEALRRTLGDPSLRLVYVVDDNSFVDVRGQPVTMSDAPGRALAHVRRRGRLLAVVEHDAVLREQKAATAAAIAAVGMAIYTTMQAKLGELRSSRLHLAQTAFDERKRIQGDIHDGAQQHFFRVLMLLDAARRGLPPTDDARRAALDRAHRELTDALDALRELVQGIYPVILVEHGLAAAVENLADRASLPVDVAISSGRWAKHVEITAYFVISEALTNVYKHSNATQVRVAVHAANGDLVATVTDDGDGGAAFGNGLRGLQHRVDAVGGRLEIISEAGNGTTLRATIPDSPMEVDS